MLGNFSFGDYFKDEAIRVGARADHRGLRDRPRPAVGHGLSRPTTRRSALGRRRRASPPERIVRRGKFDEDGEPANFWWTHAAGPGGPCSEIFVDRGPQLRSRGRARRRRGALHGDLEPRVHAGPVRRATRGRGDAAGEEHRHRLSLERVAMVLQGVDNVFETDLFSPCSRWPSDARARVTARTRNDDVPSRSWPNTAAPRRS